MSMDGNNAHTNAHLYMIGHPHLLVVVFLKIITGAYCHVMASRKRRIMHMNYYIVQVNGVYQ
jgi:hypothetical protein